MTTYFHKFIIVILPCLLITCDKKTNECEKFFPSEEISQLSLDNVCNFWKYDSIRTISDYVTFSFDADSNHISSIMYHSYGGKMISVSVFSSKESAILAMEYRANDVSAVILPEDSCYLAKFEQHWCSNSTMDINEKCWYGQYGNFQRAIFLNKWNTIVETANLNDDFSDSTRVLLEDAILEVAKRVNELSYCMDSK